MQDVHVLHHQPETASFMAAIEAKLGKHSKQRGSESVEWNWCQDYLWVVQSIKQIPVSLQGGIFIDIIEEGRQLDDL